VLDFFKHGEREVVETVCLVIFPFISLMKSQVSSLNEEGVQAVVLTMTDKAMADKMTAKVVNKTQAFALA